MTTPHAELLRECPFCGGKAVHSEGIKGDQPWHYVECLSCAAMAEPDVWNRRAAPTVEGKWVPVREEILEEAASIACAAAIRFHARSLKSPSAPQQASGWIAVPVEPTPEMCAAYYDLCREQNTLAVAASDIYRAMLAAAPKDKP